MALAPPPGTRVRSRCLRMSTGASRETREISPKTNSSATRSATAVTVTFGNVCTIFCRRSVSLECLDMGERPKYPPKSTTVSTGRRCVLCISPAGKLEGLRSVIGLTTGGSPRRRCPDVTGDALVPGTTLQNLGAFSVRGRVKVVALLRDQPIYGNTFGLLRLGHKADDSFGAILGLIYRPVPVSPIGGVYVIAAGSTDQTEQGHSVWQVGGGGVSCHAFIRISDRSGLLTLRIEGSVEMSAG